MAQGRIPNRGGFKDWHGNLLAIFQNFPIELSELPFAIERKLDIRQELEERRPFALISLKLKFDPPCAETQPTGAT